MEYGFIPTNEKLARKANSLAPGDIAFAVEGNSLYGLFGKAEVEGTAGRLIRYFQFRERWDYFNINEIREFYRLKNWSEYLDLGIFFGLAGPWFDDSMSVGGWRQADFVRLLNDGRCAVTDEFILWCAGKSDEVRGVRNKAA